MSMPTNFHPAVVFIAQHSGKALDCSSGSAHQQTANGSPGQTFYLVDAGNGYVNIVNKQTGQFLDVEGVSQDNGARVLTWTPHGNANQDFKLVDVGAGYFSIIAKHSGKCLDVNNVSHDDGANITQWDHNNGQNQHWRMDRVRSDAVKIRVKATNRVIAPVGHTDGSRLLSQDDNGSENQRWVLHPTSDGYYHIIHQQSGRAIDVEGGRTDNGTHVCIWDVHTNPWQEFKFHSLGNGWFVLIPRHAEAHKRALDIPHDHNANLLIWDQHNQDNQQVRFDF